MVPTSHISDIVALTSHIHPFCISHIPYTKDLDQNLKSNKSLCILFVLNHDIALSIVIFIIFVGRIDFSSDGKGIDTFFVLIIYIFQEHRNICKSPGRGGGGAYYVTSHQARCNRLRCPLARMSGLQCFNMGHNGHGINLCGVSMTLMGN